MFLISRCGLRKPPGGASKCQRKSTGWGVAWDPTGRRGSALLCQGVSGRRRAAGPVEGPGPAWVRLCSLSCFSCHLSDGIINICCSFLLRHTARSLPGKQDCLASSRRGNPRTWGLRPTVTREVWEEARTTVKSAKLSPSEQAKPSPRLCPGAVGHSSGPCFTWTHM